MTKRIGLFDLHNIDTQITMSPTVKDKEMIFEDLVTSAKQTTITKFTQKNTYWESSSSCKSSIRNVGFTSKGNKRI